MAAKGGSIEKVSIRRRIIAVAADADANLDLGGKTNEVQSNGDGTVRVIQTRKPWMTDGLALSCDDGNNDLEFLQEVANSGVPVPITITLASGVTYQGEGTLTGDLKKSTQNATVPVTLSGPGELTQQ
jgi:hypothetical protein